MIKTFSLAALVLISIPAMAQETTIEPIPAHTTKFAFKVYNLTTIRPDVETGSYSQFAHEFKQDDFLQPAIALRIQNKNRNFHEIELSEFFIRKRQDRFIQSTPFFPATISGTELITTSLAARYEFIRPFFKNNNRSLVPAIGIAGGVFYQRFKTNPYTTAVFPVTETMTGMRGFIVPRLNWYAGKRLFFDLNVPLCLLQADYQHSDQKNPTIPKAAQSMGVLNFELLPNYYSFRIGAGWKI